MAAPRLPEGVRVRTRIIRTRMLARDGGKHLPKPDAVGLGGDRGEMAPELRSTCGKIAEKEALEPVLRGGFSRASVGENSHGAWHLPCMG